jgi:putative N6-adenine-specific DNA methylase
VTRSYFVACTLGLEPAVVAELQELGITGEAARGGVRFAGSRRDGYAAALWLRSAVHVQEEILAGPVASPEGLYDLVASVDWSRHLDPSLTLAVDATLRDAGLTHSKYAALRVKDAIVDQFRARTGRRPSVDVEVPDLPLKLVIRRDQAILYRSLAAGSLHKRGWRPIQVKSPLNEATAAGLLRLTGWDRRSPLIDPMCGSGTFPIEAALLASERAPGLGREFAFTRWPDFDAAAWRDLVADAERRRRSTLPFPILGADRHDGALRIARDSARRAGVADLVRFARADVGALDPGFAPAIVVVNPPYGERLGTGDDLVGSWRALGRFLHERCAGAVAWVLSGSPELTRHLGLRASQRIPVRNGPLDCRWLRYEIQGSGESWGGSGAPRPSP